MNPTPPPVPAELTELTERFNRLRPIIEGMAYRMRPADEDLLADGLLKLWEMIRDEWPDDAFVIAAVRNAMIDRIRYQKVRERNQQITALIEAQTDPPETEVDYQDLLAILPLRLRRAFQLYCLGEFTTPEIARRLGLAEATLKRKIVKAKKILRNHLK